MTKNGSPSERKGRVVKGREAQGVAGSGIDWRLAACAVCAAGLGSWAIGRGETTLAVPEGYAHAQMVPRRQWRGNLHAAELSEPVILVGSPVSSWPALRLWSPSWLSSERDMKVNASCFEGHVFQYEERWRLLTESMSASASSSSSSTSTSTSASSTTKTYTMMSMAAFWAACSPSHPPPRTALPLSFYLSQSLHELPLLADDVDFASLLPPSALPSAVTQVWMGRGITSHTHYDPFHNHFVQIYGQKTFLLSPPSDSKHMYAAPFHSPLDRQSQVSNWSDPEMARFPLFGQSTAHIAHLQPGEVLLLPAYWWHRVSAPSASISVNSWYPAMASEISDGLSAEGLPSAVLKRDAASAAVFLRQLCAAVTGTEAADNGVRPSAMAQLVEQRYRPIFDRIGCEDFDVARCPAEAHLDAATFNDIGRYANQLARRLLPVDVAVRTTLLYDFVERVAAYVVVAVDGNGGGKVDGGARMCRLLRCVADSQAWRSP